jgi:PAS domain S-box-containing protein
MAAALVLKASGFHKIVPRLLSAGRRRVLGSGLALIALIAITDSQVRNVSLAGLYIFPMLLSATVLSSRAIVGLALVCAFLRCYFDESRLMVQYGLHFSFSLMSYALSGLFMLAIVRNREMALQHLAQITREQHLRNEAEERLKTLVESSPAGILTLDQRGVVVAANHSAKLLFGLEQDQRLEGRSIKPYMPTLSEALRLGAGGKPFRTAAQAQGRKENGECFPADLWFSTYAVREEIYLAAIIVDTSEEMRDREEQNLRNLSTSSRLVVAAVLHEVRNLCSAISVVYSNLTERDTPCRVDEIQGLETLVKGLSRVASLELGQREYDVPEVPLQKVLDELRIIIEPNWHEIDGCVTWVLPEPIFWVLADRYALMQVFLNLAQNSFRAVQSRPVRGLSISVISRAERALVVFRDTGCGIPDPSHLFQPFQEGADVTGLGLFISRVLVRSYGGELQYREVDGGCSFIVELPLVMGKNNV